MNFRLGSHFNCYHGKNFRLQKEFWNCQDGSLMDHVSSFFFSHAFILLLFWLYDLYPLEVLFVHLWVFVLLLVTIIVCVTCVETASHPCSQNGSSLSLSVPSCLTWFYLLRVCITWMSLERHCTQMEQFQNFLPVLLQPLNLLASHKRARKRSSAMVLSDCHMGCR